jgi:hypothetical protein
MDTILQTLTRTFDGGPGGIELIVLMVPAVGVLARSCRQLLERPPDR